MLHAIRSVLLLALASLLLAAGTIFLMGTAWIGPEETALKIGRSVAALIDGPHAADGMPAGASVPARD